MNFWDVHGIWSGIWFLIFLGFFPRITMLVMSICFMGFAHPVLFWFGWVLMPRLVVAVLATSFYWQTNPVLCVFAWLIALCGESAEKKTLRSER